MILYILTALFWGSLGWLTRVVQTYWSHSRKVEADPKGRFKWDSFKRKYDQDWIFGFILMIGLSLTSDWAWGAFLNDLLVRFISIPENIPYDPKINLFLGYIGLFLIEKLAKKTS